MLTLLFAHEPLYPMLYKKDNYDNLQIKGFNEYSSQSSSNSLSSAEPEQDPNYGPEEDPDDDDFIKKTVDNNNLLTVKPKHKFNLQHMLYLVNLKSTPVSVLYSLSKDRKLILNEFKKKAVFILYTLTLMENNI
jgi:hypothetical protein